MVQSSYIVCLIAVCEPVNIVLQNGERLQKSNKFRRESFYCGYFNFLIQISLIFSTFLCISSLCDDLCIIVLSNLSFTNIQQHKFYICVKYFQFNMNAMVCALDFGYNVVWLAKFINAYCHIISQIQDVFIHNI